MGSILSPLLALGVVPLLAAALSPTPAQRSRRAPQGLTAFRPQHGAGYAPFERTRVPEGLEEDPELGPGIRVNGPGELDPGGEDDLIELVVGRALEDATLVVQRSGPELGVWGTRDRQPGSALAFTGNRSAPLVFQGASTLTLWVEWGGASPGLASLGLRALEPDLELDRLLFHAFQGLVVALGGEGQTPVIPADPNHGTFLVGIELYERGYDVLIRDEDEVSSTGAGLVFDEVVNAIQHRAVGELAVFGFSHGGGSTFDLCERLNTFRPTIGTFTISFTSYTDAVQNDSDIDLDMELRRPISSGFHANHFQHGSFADFGLDGGPVNLSLPPPSGLDVETTPWGADSTHFLVDDYTEVRDFILAELEPRVSR